MIVDTTIVSDLSLGVARTVPQPGDAEITVPAILVPSITPIVGAMFAFPPATTPQRTSFISQIDNSRNNQAQAVVNFVNLAKGHWDIDLQVSAWFNWVAIALAAEGYLIRFVYPNGSQPIVLMRVPTIGGFVDTLNTRLLFNEDVQITVTVGTNGVGQFSEARVSIIARRLI